MKQDEERRMVDDYQDGPDKENIANNTPRGYGDELWMTKVTASNTPRGRGGGDDDYDRDYDDSTTTTTTTTTSSTTNDGGGRRLSGTTKTTTSTIYDDVDLLMVSPPPPSPAMPPRRPRDYRRRSTSSAHADDDARLETAMPPAATTMTTPTPSSSSPVPPPNSENIRAAIREAGRALDAEVRGVHKFLGHPVTYSGGSTSPKPVRRSLFSIAAILEDEYDVDDDDDASSTIDLSGQQMDFEDDEDDDVGDVASAPIEEEVEEEVEEEEEDDEEEDIPSKSRDPGRRIFIDDDDEDDESSDDDVGGGAASASIEERAAEEEELPMARDRRRRMVIDDEEDDESLDEDNESSDDDGGGSASGSVTGERSRKEEEEVIAPSMGVSSGGVVIDGMTGDDGLGRGFSGLTLDDDDDESGDSDGGVANGPRTPDVGGDDNDDASRFDNEESKRSDDDESMTCFDGCGCWDIDDEHPGDLHLSGETDGARWPRVRLPLALYDKLFRHQRIGVQWMASLHGNEIGGGILADDMGLGKTMQTLAYLGSLMRARTISNAIVVCPKSVVQNWEREANLILKNMCVPRATVYAVTSDISKERRLQIFTDSLCSSANAPRLVVTTYGLVSNHISDLNSIANAHQEFRWCYVILDEGHLIKNSKTKTSRDVRLLSRNKNTRRLLLTGTPIQNNMQELHALFDWATSSKLLGSLQKFLNRYGHPIEEGRQRNATEWTVKKAAEMSSELQKLLQPYFLQRLKKTEFAGTMPEKKELVVFTRLSAKQRRMYEDFTERVIFDGEMSLSPLAAVSWLKMLCGHPSLVKEASRKYINCDADLLIKDSAKLQVLIALLCRLKRSGHRALVFSQSTKMLDVVERVCNHSSLSYLRIDGSSTGKSRQKAVDHFNDINSGIDTMLLSTKAAGIGLTLTGADRAIIYDPSWNPAEDAQAVDRCYRIGQTKEVTVYRFIAAGTVEEKMYEKQVHKDGIKRVVLSSDSAKVFRYFDNSELKELFKLSPDGVSLTLQKFNEKVDNNAAVASEKPSFLTKHPSVVGVASHDVLYSAGEVDDNDDLILPKSDETPFSRSPFQKTKIDKKDSQLIHHFEDLTIQSPVGGALKPLGGKNNKTRQNREDARARRAQNSKTLQPVKSIGKVVRKADELIALQEHGEAMSVLLDLLDEEIDLKSDEKLALHTRVSHLASLLGWL